MGKVGGADGLAVGDLQSQLLAPRLAQGLQRGRTKGDGGGKRVSGLREKREKEAYVLYIGQAA